MEEKIFRYVIGFLIVLLLIFSGIHGYQIKNRDIVNLHRSIIAYMIALWCATLL